MLRCTRKPLAREVVVDALSGVHSGEELRIVEYHPVVGSSSEAVADDLSGVLPAVQTARSVETMERVVSPSAAKSRKRKADTDEAQSKKPRLKEPSSKKPARRSREKDEGSMRRVNDGDGFFRHVGPELTSETPSHVESRQTSVPAAEPCMIPSHVHGDFQGLEPVPSPVYGSLNPLQMPVPVHAAMHAGMLNQDSTYPYSSPSSFRMSTSPSFFSPSPSLYMSPSPSLSWTASLSPSLGSPFTPSSYPASPASPWTDGSFASPHAPLPAYHPEQYDAEPAYSYAQSGPLLNQATASSYHQHAPGPNSSYNGPCFQSYGVSAPYLQEQSVSAYQHQMDPGPYIEQAFQGYGATGQYLAPQPPFSVGLSTIVDPPLPVSSSGLEMLLFSTEPGLEDASFGDTEDGSLNIDPEMASWGLRTFGEPWF
ncbi:hypothetical protein VNI00_014064 [Paramarasmius palmivorus]|uniref:Uncharacterized protein n=1 Tax=Paramarasmius palmivorus TaxID=297713 RepID=A0AAW0BV11_9AGAR